MPYIEPNLRSYENQVHSQFGEDGVVAKLASCLAIEKATFFEFGIGPAYAGSNDKDLQGNCVLLAKNGGRGIFLDGSFYPPEYNVRREFITPLNINYLYRKYCLPDDLDFMSIDVDGQEFWIWMALQHRPKVVIIEYNGALGKEASETIEFNVNHVWDETIYHGSSLLALTKLARSKSYTLVYANGVNGFFVRDDLVSNKSDFDFEQLFVGFAPHRADPHKRRWVTI